MSQEDTTQKELVSQLQQRIADLEARLAAQQAAAPSTFKGKEVSCRVMGILFKELEAKSLRPDTLLEGIDYSLDHLLDKNKRIDWASFRRIMTNAGKIWNRQELIAIGISFTDSPWVKPFSIVARLLYTPTDYYRWITQPGSGLGRQAFSCVYALLTEISPTHLQLDMMMEPGYEPSPEFYLISQGTLISVPRLLGLKPATVTLEETEAGVRFDVRIPPGGGTVRWLRRAVTWPFSAKTAAQELRLAYDSLFKQNLYLEKQIIERKRAEEALKANQERYQLVTKLISQLPYGYDVDDEGNLKLIWGTPEAEKRVLGYDQGEIEAKGGWKSLIHLEDLPAVQNHEQILLNGQTSMVEYRVTTKSGNPRWLLDFASPIWDDEKNRVVRLYGAAQDITDRKLAEDALRDSEQRYRKLFASAHRQTQELTLLDQVRSTIAQELELSEVIKMVVEAIADTFGYTLVSLYLIEGNSLILQHQVGYHKEITEIPLNQGVSGRVVRSGQPLLIEDVTADPDFLGAIENITSEICVPLLDQDKVVGIFNIESSLGFTLTQADLNLMTALGEHINIAIGRARLYTKVRDSERRFRSIFESSPVGILTANAAGIITDINPAYLNIIGVTDGCEQIVGQFSLFKSNIFNTSEFNRHLAQLYQGQSFTLETTLSTLNNSKKTVFHMATPFLNDQGQVTGCILVTEDVSERKQLEAQLRQSQKMEAIGRLAGGIAHDFNNILTVIIGNAELVLSNLSPTNPVHKDIKQINEVAQRAASLTSQLLTFSRQQVLQPKILNLNTIILKMQGLLARLIGEYIELKINLKADNALIKIDPGQIEQVILNLAINARDAMPEGGKLTIETDLAFLDEAYTAEHMGVIPGSYIVLALSDTGAGMSSETQAHIFEPFFTTKKQGKGTGLGLATIHGIISQSNGHIWVYSEPGHGTTFKVYLPQIQDLPDIAPDQQLTLSAPENTTVLVVEDEEMVRELACRTLNRQGYVVLEAQNGPEALNVAAVHQGRIDLLLTDVIMPGGMNGRQLAEKLQTQYPHIKVLFMSGYTDNIIIHHGELDPETAFLPKPYTPNTLLRKIIEVLTT